MTDLTPLICSRPIRARELLTRHATITGLRALADFLEDNPAVPVEKYGPTLHLFARAANDSAETAMVDHAAALLGVPVEDDRAQGGHYIARRHFGAISYEFVHIPSRRRLESRARDSYRDNIAVDTDATSGANEISGQAA